MPHILEEKYVGISPDIFFYKKYSRSDNMLYKSKNQSLNFKQTTLIASMLFGLFFGAGNLIFPIYMGNLAGNKIFIALLGFLITGVGLPLLGVASIGVSKSEGLIELSSKVGKGYGVFFTCVLYLTIGPCFAIPRCATVPFTVAVEHMLGEGVNVQAILAIFTAIFFAIVLAFSLFPSKILTWVGKILTPLFLVFLAVLVIAALVKPMGSITSTPAQNDYTSKAFATGFLEGYNTMDALASLAFGIVVIDVIRKQGVTSPSSIAKNTIKSGALSCLFMALIYLGVSVIGAQSGALFGQSFNNGGEVFVKVSDHYFNKAGIVILAIIVTLACLKTAIGLVTSASETFVKLFPKFLPYRAWAVIFSIVSFLIANLGLTSIIAYAVPVLMFLYPLAITLILLGLFGNTFKHRRCIYVSTTSFTLVAAIFDLIAALPSSVVAKLHAEGTLAFLSEHVPLFKYGMGWLIPALVGLAIGIIYAVATKKQAAWKYDICQKDTSEYVLEKTIVQNECDIA